MLKAVRLTAWLAGAHRALIYLEKCGVVHPPIVQSASVLYKMYASDVEGKCNTVLVIQLYLISI